MKPLALRHSNHRRSVTYFAVIVVSIIASLASPARVSTAKAGPDAGVSRVQFDVPAQPLEAALESFMAAANVAVLVDSAVISGRRSAALQGSFSPEGALRSLLEGTGLDPRPIGSSAYTLVPSPGTTDVRPQPRFVKYAAAIQQAVTTALCLRDETRPTHYRTVMRLWLSAVGTVTRVEISSTTGSPSLDVAIGDALKQIDVGAPTPSGLPQPVKLAILPRAVNDAACPSGEEVGGRPALNSPR
jgi:hypothetical protein